MITCIVIVNEEIRRDSSKLLGRCNRFQNSQLLIVKSKTRFLNRNVLCMSVNFAASKRGKMEV